LMRDYSTLSTLILDGIRTLFDLNDELARYISLDL